MDTQTLEHFKSLFVQLRADTLSEICERLENDCQIKGDDVDLAIDERERLLNQKLSGRQNFFLKKIGESLDKIDNGTFGECEDCGAQIKTQRLMARPTATLCISCKEEQERSELHIRYDKKSHTHSKNLGDGTNIVELHKKNKELANEFTQINANSMIQKLC